LPGEALRIFVPAGARIAAMAADELPTAAQAAPARSGTLTTAQLYVGAMAAPALAVNLNRRATPLHVRAGGVRVFWGGSAAVTALTGFELPSGQVHDVVPGFNGEVWLIADAAGPTRVSLHQLG